MVKKRNYKTEREYALIRSKVLANVQDLLVFVESEETRTHEGKNWADIGSLVKINNDLLEAKRFLAIK